MSRYQPPFQLTHRMTALVADIAERLGAWKAANRAALVPELRRDNRIRTLQASLAIEQSTLSVEQVTAVLAGKPVLGSPKEVQEVRNAFATYEAMESWHPHRLADLLQAHGLLMAGLVGHPGKLRDGHVGIWRGGRLWCTRLAQAVGRSLRTVERAAARLQSEGKLRYLGPKKGGHWDVL